jgi:hypothetical protein
MLRTEVESMTALQTELLSLPEWITGMTSERWSLSLRNDTVSKITNKGQTLTLPSGSGKIEMAT